MGRQSNSGGGRGRTKRPGPPMRGRPGGGGTKRGKPKRSKKFWQQRKTLDIAPVPGNSDDEGGKDVSEEEQEEEIVTNYDRLLDAFGSNSKQNEAVDSESGSESEGKDEDNEEPTIQSSEEVENDDELEEEEEGSGMEDDDGEEFELNDLEKEVSESEDEDTTTNDLTGGPKDPFVVRYEPEIPSTLAAVVEEKDYRTEMLDWKQTGRLIVQTPNWSLAPNEKRRCTKRALDIEEEDDSEVKKNQASFVTRKLTVMKEKKLESAFVKQQVSRNIATANEANSMPSTLTPFQTELFSIMNSYKDFCFNERTHQNGESIRVVYTLHALNHVLKTRTRILLNNAKGAKEGKDGCRDQGLCRPRVLILLPFRDSVKRVVNIMAKLLFADEKGKVSNRSRFDEEFDSDDRRKASKPDDFYDTFSGNVDDSFKIGLAVTKKNLKLYADFYSSDIIIASPLGLRLVLGSEGDKDRDFDFLTSIELLIMDQVDIFAMQNWEHVTHLMSHLHLQPARSHGVDFSRVRMWTLNKLSHMYRQTLLFSRIAMPEMNAIFSKSCHNYMGRVRQSNIVVTGNISQVLVKVPMVFHRIDSGSIKDSLDDRFNYFTNKIMPEYKKDMMFHTFVFVPSYFDYVKARNWFSKSDLDFLEICEYTKDKKIAKARDLFFHGETHFMLYTERVHFYRRFSIKGIRHLVFYQLPQYPHFFSELCNFMQAANLNRKGGSDGNMTCTVLYNKYDMPRLSAVVGTDRANHMINAEKNVHMFVAGS